MAQAEKERENEPLIVNFIAGKSVYASLEY